LDATDPKKTSTLDTEEEQTHTLEVQTIGGGPKTIVQAQTVIDGEGIPIPIGNHHEPYQGAPSSTSSTFAVAAAFLPDHHIISPEQSSLAGTMTSIPQDDGLLYPKARDSRINSVSSIVTPQIHSDESGLRETDTSGNGESNSSATNGDSTSRREGSASSTLTVRRDLGQRASSARSAPISPPLSIRSAINLQRASSQDVDTDEESSSKWSEGSISNSWQLGMAGDHRPSRPTMSTSQHKQQSQELPRYGSPLSQDSTEHYFTLSASPIDQTHSEARRNIEVLPTSQVEQVLEDEGIIPARTGTGSSSSSHGSTGQGRRRRPPAPPMSDGGLASRKERRAMLSSTSETHLPSSSSSTMTSSKKDSLPRNVALDMVSLPNSPRAESLASSREPSPTLDNLPSSRRRRPPPPPVNRATKGSRTPSQQVQILQGDSENRLAERRRSLDQEHQTQVHDAHGNRVAGEDNQLNRAMNYLYISESGYGW